MTKDNQFDIFNQNLKFILQENNLTQKGLSEKTEISCATLNNYINQKAEPSVNFLIKLKELYGYKIDDMLESDLSKKIDTHPTYNTKMERFVGSYIMYFYNSGEYKGKVSSYSKNTLKYAVLSVMEDKNTGKLSVMANFIKNRDDAEEFKISLEECKTNDEIESIHKAGDQLYLGNLEASDKQIFIYLKSESLNDQSLIILNNPPSNNNYLGGLGTGNSVSRGREHMPCVQFVLLSKYILKVSDGEIYNMLALGVSDINVETEAEQLINLFKNLYINNETLKDDLTSIQKKKIVENSLNAIVSDLIDANMFRFAKVSNMEDDDYYRIIKDEIGV